MAKASGQNVNTPKPITREEKFLEQIAENGGKANSWKDLGEKTVMGDTLTWDGNTEGHYNIMNEYYHVSDIVPTLEDLKRGVILYGNDGNVVEFDSEAVIPMGESVIGILPDDYPLVLVALVDNATTSIVEGEVFILEKAGIYFLLIQDNGFHIEKLTINGYNGFPRTEIKTIDPKYLPKGNLFVNLVCGDDGDYTLDKTFAEMHDAIVAGRTVQLNDNGAVFNLSWRSDDSLSFTSLLTNGSFTECTSYHIDSDNKIEEHYVELVSKS